MRSRSTKRAPDDDISVAVRNLLEIESSARVSQSVQRLYYHDTEHRRMLLHRVETAENQKHTYQPATLNPTLPARTPFDTERSPRLDREHLDEFVHRIHDDDLRKRRQKQHELERKLYPNQKKVIDRVALKQSVERLYERPMRVKKFESKTKKPTELDKTQKPHQSSPERKAWCFTPKTADPKREDIKLIVPLKKEKEVQKKTQQRAFSADAVRRLSRPRDIVPTKETKNVRAKSSRRK
eukprot:PhF_6_TR12559/c0_g1_i1/m.19680